MARKPNLDGLDVYFKKGKDFRLTVVPQIR